MEECSLGIFECQNCAWSGDDAVDNDTNYEHIFCPDCGEELEFPEFDDNE